MPTFPGYQVRETLYKSDRSLVFRARRESDEQPVILKTTVTDRPAPAEVARLRSEYAILSNLNINGVIRTYGLEQYEARLVLVLEDFGGRSLNTFRKHDFFSLPEILRISSRLAEILGEVHSAWIIHKDVNPANVVFNKETGTLKLIDFDLASTFFHQEMTTSRLQWTLAYISPEQTGRTARPLDYRTDYYSFGVLLYELLTGQIPFITDNLLEMVHSHLALTPKPPSSLNPEIPQPLSDIVLKLLAKSADDRYQGAWGIKTDLEECLIQIETKERIDPFSLGARDISLRFLIPQRLYGRNSEIYVMMNALDRVRQGRKEMILISGEAGVGKSALVREFSESVFRTEGSFISSKFEQFQPTGGSSGFTGALQGLIRHLLMETEARLNDWRTTIMAALGSNGRVITDILPELERIIGLQPPVPDLSPTESENRFRFVFKRFFKVFCRSETPLVLFLDDLQWLDSSSLGLLELIFNDEELQSFLFIGAYRDNEVGTNHRLISTLDRLRNQGQTVNHVHLRSLKLGEVTDLISDAVHLSVDSTSPLAEVVFQKTGGNPFWISEFLKSLYLEKLLTIDSCKAIFQWDLEKIRSLNISDNIVEFMRDKIAKLDSRIQELLKLAACLGSQFDIETLSIISEQSVTDTQTCLHQSLEEGFILPVMLEEWTSIEYSDSHSGHVSTTHYRFCHDQVQQAAHRLIPEPDQLAVHWKIGRLLLDNTSESNRRVKIFTIVDQLNFGISLIERQQERDELAQLNFAAGMKALRTFAHERALTYFEIGIELFGEGGWERSYAQTLELHLKATQAAYLTGDLKKIANFAEAAQIRAVSVLDRVQVYEITIQSQVSRDHLAQAVDTALTALIELGVNLPQKPNKLHVLFGLLKTKFFLTGRKIEDLIDLPEMNDASKLAAMRIMSIAGPPAYMTTPLLVPLMLFKMIDWSLKHGNASSSSHCYSGLGMLMCGVFGDIDRGYRFGELALKVVDHFGAEDYRCRVSFLFHYCIRHWKNSVHESLLPLFQGYEHGMANGDVEPAVRSGTAHSSPLTKIDPLVLRKTDP
jgi:predicted ATPase